MAVDTVYWKAKHKNLIGSELRIINSYLAETSSEELARQYDVNVDTIKRLLSNNKVKLRTRKESRNTANYNKKRNNTIQYKFSKTEVDNIIKEYKRGVGIVTLAKNLSVDNCVIQRILRENNITLRSAKEQSKFSSTVTAELAAKTIIKKYGGYHFTNLIQQDNLYKKHGVRNVMQLPDVFEKQQKSAKKVKTTFIDGVEISYQGYEYRAIRLLLEQGYKITDLTLTKANVPSIKYTFNNKSRIYFPDIYIASENRIIEVKSKWTYTNWLDQNLAKRDACILAGYKFDFMIL